MRQAAESGIKIQQSHFCGIVSRDFGLGFRGIGSLPQPAERMVAFRSSDFFIPLF
jgi:hypothetical protein